jgi:hypothetical protein
MDTESRVSKVTGDGNRKHRRYTVKIEARVSTGSEELVAVTKDMSRGGICLLAPKAVATGSKIGLSLSLVLGTNTFSESLKLGGRVVWCTAIEKQFQLGVVFLELNPQKASYLDLFLKFLQEELIIKDQGQGVEESSETAEGESP